MGNVATPRCCHASIADLMIFADRRRYAVALAGAGAFLNLYSPQAVLPLLAEGIRHDRSGHRAHHVRVDPCVALTAPFTGVIADVIGRKRVITAAMIALVIPTVMSALSPNLETMIFWRFVQGLVLPPIFAVTIAYIGGEMPADEATGMTGTYAVGAALGGFTGRLLTGLLAEPIGWRNAFLVDAALTALLAIAVIVLLAARKAIRARRQFEGVAQADGPASAQSEIDGDLRRRLRRAVQFHRDLHLRQLPSRGTAIQSVARRARPHLHRLSRRHLHRAAGRQGVSRFGRRRFVIAILALWILRHAADPRALAACGDRRASTLAAACGFLCQAASQAYVATSSKTGISAAIGLYVTAFYVGGSVGALLPGLAWPIAKWPGTVAMVVAMQTIMMLIVWLAWSKDRR